MQAARLSLVIPVLAMWALTACAQGATYYVAQGAPNASDENAGSEEQPWLTIAKAAETALAGDTVHIKAGTYRESVIVRNSGTTGKPITFCAFDNDEVIITGAEIVPASAWTQVEGTTTVYRSKAEAFKYAVSADSAYNPGADPYASWFEVFVDGRRVPHHHDRNTCGLKWGKHIEPLKEHEPLSDADVMKYLLEKDGTLFLNTGDGNPAEKHSIEVAARIQGIGGADFIELRGLCVEGFGFQAVKLGDDCVVEDCVFVNNGFSAEVHRGSAIRRCTCRWDGGGSVRAYGGTVENCLIIEGQVHQAYNSYQWTMTATLAGQDAAVRYNIAVGVLRVQLHPQLGWGAVLWGDIGPYMGAWYGNALWHNASWGIYLEAFMSNCVLMHNISAYNDAGVVFRMSQRNYLLHNWVHHNDRGVTFLQPFTSWGLPSSTADNVVRQNLITDNATAIQFEPDVPLAKWPRTDPRNTNGNLLDENTYNQRNPRVNWGQKTDFESFAAFQKFSGQEGKAVIDETITPERAGLGLVWFKVPGFPSAAGEIDAAKRAEMAKPIAMIGNPHLAIGDPSQGGGFYFWYVKPTGSCDELWRRSGVQLTSVSLPCVPGTVVTMRAKVRGEGMKIEGPDGGPLVRVEFVSATGQQRSVVDVPTPLVSPKAWSGNFGWRYLRGAVPVPEQARWWRLLLGKRSASGLLEWNNLQMGVR